MSVRGSGQPHPPLQSRLLSVPHGFAQSLTEQTFKNCQVGSDPTFLPDKTACFCKFTSFLSNCWVTVSLPRQLLKLASSL